MSGNIFEDIFIVGIGLAVLPIYGAVKAVQWGVNQIQNSFTEYDEEIEEIAERSQSNTYDREQEYRDKQRLLQIEREAEQKRKQQEQEERARLKKEKEDRLKQSRLKGIRNTIEDMDFSFLEGRPQWKDVQQNRNELELLIDSDKDLDDKLYEIENIKSRMSKLVVLSEEREQKLKKRELEIAENKSEILQYLNDLKEISPSIGNFEEKKMDKIYTSNSIQHLEAYKMEIRLLLGRVIEENGLTKYYANKINSFKTDWEINDKLSILATNLLKQSKITHRDYQLFYENLSKEKMLEIAQYAIKESIDMALNKAGCTIIDEELSESTTYFDTEYGSEYKIARYYEDGKMMLQLTRFMDEEMDEKSYKEQLGSYELKRDEDIAKKWCSKLDTVLSDINSSLPSQHYQHNVISRDEPILGNSKIAYAYDARYTSVTNTIDKKRDTLKYREINSGE